MNKQNCANCYHWYNDYVEEVGIVGDWRLIEEYLAEGLCTLNQSVTTPYDKCEDWVSTNEACNT